MKTAFQEAQELIERKESFAAARVIDTAGSTPRKSGAWLLVEENGQSFGTVGGGLLEFEVQKAAKTVLESRTTQTFKFALNKNVKDGLDMNCGGDATVLIEYIDGENPGDFLKDVSTVSKAVIFGAGHVAFALETVLRHIGFTTTVVDDRAEFANRSRFPYAENIVVLENFEHPYDSVGIDGETYVVVATRGHASDYLVMRETLKRDFKYLGIIGSRKKVAIAKNKLLQEGFTEEQISRAHTPVGIKIGAETPEEISVSIAAEIIAVRAGVIK